MQLLQILKNKYFIVTVVFLCWIFFFSQYDVFTQYKQHSELKEMKRKIKYLQEEIAHLKSEKELLKSDKATLEKYAREKYYMKSPNEEVYAFDTMKSNSNDSIK